MTRWLLSAPTYSRLNHPWRMQQGTIKMSCDLCGTEVYVEPTSQVFLKDGAVPVCVPCAAEKYEQAPVEDKPMFGRVTPEQRADVGPEVMKTVDATHPLKILRDLAEMYRRERPEGLSGGGGLPVLEVDGSGEGADDRRGDGPGQGVSGPEDGTSS